MVAVLVRDRLHHTILCCDWLCDSVNCKDVYFNFVALDDRSKNALIFRYLRERFHDNVCGVPTADKMDGPTRVGIARQTAVKLFLLSTGCDFLFLMDNDVIVTKTTIANAINDYNELATHESVGGYTLHALNHIEKTHQYGEKVFAEISLTGDAHLLYRRDALEKIGNHFSGEPGGFADKQIHAIYNQGMKFWTRVTPPYEVQHIGFGEGASFCWDWEGIAPFWVRRPYWSHTGTKGVINVEGFDVLQYADLVNRYGGLEAPKLYLQMMKEKFNERK